MQTFQPNNHSKWEIEYRPVAGELPKLVGDIFIKHYGEEGDEIISIEQVNEAEINSNNFRVNFRHNGKGEVLLVRRYANNRDRAMLEDIAVVLNDLRAAGLRAPEIVSSHAGKIIEVEGEYSYTAYRFIEGDHFRGTLPEIADIAAEIGKLDALLATLPSAEKLKEKVAFPDKVLALREYTLPIWEDLFRRAGAGLTESSDKEFDQRFLDMKDLILEAVKNTPISRAGNFEKQLVHFDLHPHNLITDGEKLLAIIDFDSLRVFERMRAVSFALHRLVRQHIVYTRPEDVEVAVKAATQVFFEAYRTNMPLSDEDVRAVPYFIRTEALARLSYAMKDNYLNNNPLWRGDLDKQTASILEAKYFE